MTLYVNLHGGANYARSAEAERYPSLAAAAAEYDRRHRDSYYPCWGDPSVHDQLNDGRFHAGFAWYVDEDDPSVILTADDAGNVLFDTTDQYPDRELTVGPRGGLRWERC